MKLKNLQEELEFIRSATVRELVAYIKTAHFSHVAAEKELVKRGLTAAIEEYMLHYGFASGARIAIFRSNNLKWINLLLLMENGKTEVLEEFFAYGNYLFIWALVHNEDYFDNIPEVFPEQNLLEQKNYAALREHGNTFVLTPFAKLELIHRNIPEMTRWLITSTRLNEREKMAVMEFADWDDINLLIETEHKAERKQMFEEMRLIRFAHRNKLERFISTNRFCKNAERFFFAHGEFASVVSYIKHYGIEEMHEVILNRASPKEILGYLSQNRLCEKGEKLLLDRRKHREIKAYIKEHYFAEDNETRFIKRGQHNEIMLYISRHSLCDTAQQELMFRRNSAEIEYYVSRYPLADIAEAALLKCATPETIRIWQENIPYYNKQTT